MNDGNATGPDATSGTDSSAEASTDFYMQDKVNSFSGVTAAA